MTINEVVGRDLPGQVNGRPQLRLAMELLMMVLKKGYRWRASASRVSFLHTRCPPLRQCGVALIR